MQLLFATSSTCSLHCRLRGTFFAKGRFGGVGESQPPRFCFFWLPKEIIEYFCSFPGDSSPAALNDNLLLRVRGSLDFARDDVVGARDDGRYYVVISTEQSEWRNLNLFCHCEEGVAISWKGCMQCVKTRHVSTRFFACGSE